jgi:hypothetical protein
MGFLSNMLEDKVSTALETALGLRVSFDRLDISLSGSVDATNVRVTGRDDAPPLLTVARVKAQLAVTRLLSGEISVKSIVVERPDIRVVLGESEKANLPAKLLERRKNPAGDKQQPSEKPDDKKGWELDIEKVVISDGRVLFRWGEGPDDAVSAEAIVAELSQSGADRPFTLVVDSLSRGKASVQGIRVTGRLTGADDLMAVGAAGVEATAEIANLLKITAASGSIAGGTVAVTASAAADAKRLSELVSAATGKPDVLGLVHVDGDVRFSARVDYAPQSGLTIHELQLHAGAAPASG